VLTLVGSYLGSSQLPILLPYTFYFHMGRGAKHALAKQRSKDVRTGSPDGSKCSVEVQSKDECGLCALRHVLMPHHARHGISLPSEDDLRQHASALEIDETALLEDDDTGLLADAERADNRGNFSVDVLMRAAMCQQLTGSHLTLEYWAGQHRQASKGIELGFILGNGHHWWCIRAHGKDLQEWEEVDSMGKSHVASWLSSDDLFECLLARDETVLVLYPAPKEEEEEQDEDDVQGCVPKLRRASRKAELKAARKREKEEKKEKRLAQNSSAA